MEGHTNATIIISFVPIRVISYVGVIRISATQHVWNFPVSISASLAVYFWLLTIAWHLVVSLLVHARLFLIFGLGKNQ